MARRLRAAGEAVSLLLVVGPVWAFAAVESVWEFAVAALVAVLVALWAAHAVAARAFRFRPDAVSVALAGLVVWSAAQLVPLPLGVVRVISPGAAAVHETFRPAVAESLPGEPPGAARADWLPLSVDADATRTFAVRLTGLLLLYAAARNWLATPAALRRLARAATAVGLALAVLALGQFFSSPRDVAYWTWQQSNQIFGPFINRNHYPDFLAGCIGLGVGLMLTLRREPAATYRPRPEEESALDKLLAPFKYLDQPLPLAAAGAVALMAVSVLFSLSRGGVLALAVAGVAAAVLARRRTAAEPGGPGKWVLAGALVLAVGLASWFGWGPVRDRFATLLGPRAEADDRTGLWAEAARSGAGFWLTGSGNGTFARVETLGRTTTPPGMTNTFAHNEYLEAAVEGGAVRVVLTLVLVGGPLVSIGRGFLAGRGGADNSLLLGVWFGLAALAAHAATDFGVHLPAVAAFAAVLAGYAMGVSAAGPLRERKKRRVRVTTGRAVSSESEAPVEPTTVLADRAGSRPPGGRLLAVPVLAAVIGVAVAWDAWTRAEADRLVDGAEAFRRSDAPNRDAGRIAYLTARTRVRPGDATARFELAQAHIDRGTADDTRAALAALRAARDRCPLYPEVQFRLGLFARSFASADPPRAYLDRARQLLATDPDVWYVTGLEALRAGDEPTAWANFRHALGLSDKRQKTIVAEAGRRLPPAELAGKVLPDDPVLLMAAADQLYPDVEKQAANRRPLVERAGAKDWPGATAERYRATARALGELGRTADAEAIWRKAVAADPDPRRSRDGFAKWLEAEELYETAVPELEWLSEQYPDDRAIRLRLLTARHAAALKARLGE